MYSNPIKKLFGLFAIYAIIIIGIFVLQFKTELVFSESIGALRFTFTKTENNQKSVLKNSLQATYKGVLFYFDNKNPVTIKKQSSGTPSDITLLSWNKASPLISTFNFTEDITLSFVLSNPSDSADLIIQADLPEDVEYVSLNFKPAKGYHITDKVNSSVHIEASNSKFLLTGLNDTYDKITLFKAHPTVLYSAVNESDVFSFDATDSYALASAELYSQNLKSLETNIVTLFQDALQNNTMLTEQSVISYVAIMAKNGQYNSALDSVPDVFKKGQKRTYLSAPYFNTLEKMYITLEMGINNILKIAEKSIEQNSCDIFTVSRITDFILLNKNNAITDDLLAIPSKTQLTDITPSQAIGILDVYSNLSKANADLADKISESVLSSCLETIAKACSIREDNQKISISEDNVPFTPIQAMAAGDTLIRYGKLKGNSDLVNTGCLLANSYFTDINASDLYSFAEIYPAVVHDNSYYPHFEFMGEDNGKTVWAWTCASSVNYSKDENANTAIDIVFPQGLTHYVMIGGIPSFQKIQIYDIDFRTDFRFEMYNSSGYVHLKSSDMLLLKSRHRVEKETVRLIYNVPSAVPANSETANEE